MRRPLALALMLLAAAPAATAAPERYILDAAASIVAFEVDYGSTPLEGRMPVAGADIVLDFDRPADSSIRVALDVARARMPFPFAAEALRSRAVLDAASHPTITFESTALRAAGTTAEVDGILTARGVARPVRLAVEFYRQAGTAPGDRAALSIHIRTRLSRADFGATGFAAEVGDEVRILIVARIDRAG